MYQKRNPALILILCVITCGIYLYYWMYVTSRDLGAMLQNDNNPALEIVLTIVTCGLYSIYWYYRLGKQIHEAQIRCGYPYPSDDSIIYILLSVFGLSIANVAIAQNNLNKIYN